MNKHRLLALDPSSAAIGYALMEGPLSLIEAGRITPSAKKLAAMERVRDLVSQLRAGRITPSRRKSLSALDRVFDLVSQLRAEFPRLSPWRVIVEMPGRHQSKRSGHGAAGASLMQYGMACGAVWQMCLDLMPEGAVTTFLTSEWDSSKEKRALGVRSEFPQYGSIRDPGMDVSDAIALGQRWFERRMS